MCIRDRYKAFKEFRIPTHLIKLIQESLSRVECKVKVQKTMSCSFTTRTGLQQGDSLSCLLFNLALEKVIRDSQINIRGTILNKG